RRGARHPRVHLDDDHPAGGRLDGELDVAAAGVDADLADDRDADVAHLLELAVGEGHRGRDGHRVAGVDADGVDVLDRAHDDDVVRLVADELELELLPAQDRLLEEHLGGRRVVQAGAGDPLEVRGVVGQARAEPAHGERGAHDEREAELLRGRVALPHRVADRRTGRLGAAPLDDVLERLRSSAAWIEATEAPMSSTPYSASTPASSSAIAVLSAV